MKISGSKVDVGRLDRDGGQIPAGSRKPVGFPLSIKRPDTGGLIPLHGAGIVEAPNGMLYRIPQFVSSRSTERASLKLPPRDLHSALGMVSSRSTERASLKRRIGLRSAATACGLIPLHGAGIVEARAYSSLSAAKSVSSRSTERASLKRPGAPSCQRSAGVSSRSTERASLKPLPSRGPVVLGHVSSRSTERASLKPTRCPGTTWRAPSLIPLHGAGIVEAQAKAVKFLSPPCLIPLHGAGIVEAPISGQLDTSACRLIPLHGAGIVEARCHRSS